MKIKEVIFIILNTMFNLFYWIIGIFVFFTTIYNTYYDINRVISGEHIITNIKWFLGMTPTIFFIFFFIFLIFKLIILKNIVRIFAAFSAILYCLILYWGNQEIYLIVSLLFFIITLLKLKNFQFKTKTKNINIFSVAYFKYFLYSLFLVFLMILIDIFLKFSPQEETFMYLLSIIFSYSILILSIILLIISALFKIKTISTIKPFSLLASPKIIINTKKISIYFIVSYILLYLMTYLIAYMTNTYETDLANINFQNLLI